MNAELIEKKYQISLSQDYKDFIYHRPNGFMVEEPNFIEFEVCFLVESLVVLDKIYGFDELIEMNSELLSDINDFLKCIVIGEDPGGNFFLIEDITGRILYWDRTNLHKALNTSKRVPTPEIDLSISRNEEIYYIFDGFKDLESLIKV